ncbi:peptide MFS transporter [Bacillus atrophaeus]|uniref:Di-tripeptide-proton ABC symporter n=1 Tax=Bacillus atrophaeus (strain 1942) TaxID=720555 RepID=A0ABM5M4E6_BACA1|nr:peptide MFS transporter [Bacillus atrophaeus]AMR64137.1 peptide transporter [Bacillus subtilis subsp. globigii]ADP35018.1 di-tripeptide-proton ABC symporter [Bacillus atrophaeus 1942]AIK45537.1 amino acid/peptide transporter family protein [Bacillus atrophaeus subsp. globigii]AKL85479.1 YclF [Bacillus atrophaeus UCMB-5137]ARW05446.1 putative transporter YclF [Bacillus atrophaeus]
MASIDNESIIKSVPQKGFFGHPRGLFTLFFTEFWERFSYYGMRAILLYYLYTETVNGGLGFDKGTAVAIMSIYGSLVYMSGIIGGWLADRLFGTANTVFYGGILIMFGHIVLAFPGSATAFFISMALIIIGTGLLKPNVSSVVGDLYTKEDPRRDSGFSIFVMGINLGALIAPLIVGTLGQEYSYHLGFGTAAVGMLLGLIVFALTRKKNLGLAGSNVPNPLSKKAALGTGIGLIIVIIAAIIAIQTGILNIERFINLVSILGILIPIAYFIVMFTSKKATKTEKSRLAAYIPLFIAAMMFWAIQEQGATILALYADERTKLSLGGLELQSSWFQSLNPLFVVIFAPIYAWLWMKLGKRQPSTPVKFAIGIILAGLSFVIMIFPAMQGKDALVSPLWLVLSFLLVVLGEMCVSPVGLSVTTKLAPAAFSAQTMSLWFLTNASAQAINAKVSVFFGKVSDSAYFGTIGLVSIILGGILLLLSPVIKRAMKGVL